MTNKLPELKEYRLAANTIEHYEYFEVVDEHIQDLWINGESFKVATFNSIKERELAIVKRLDIIKNMIIDNEEKRPCKLDDINTALQELIAELERKE